MIQVFKIGGHLLDEEAAMKRFCEVFAAVPGSKILVHGGGALASKLQERMGETPQMINGRRVTDESSLNIVTMVYAGWCNKRLVSLLQAMGCNAIGLSGCDGSLITASKREPLDGVDFGFVGDVTPHSVNTAFLRSLLDDGLVPVLSPINHDGKGKLLNTNADTVAASVASALGASLTLVFEKEGVLDASGRVIPLIDEASFHQLKADGTVSGGMLPKLGNAFEALRSGTSAVRICGESLSGGTLCHLSI